MTVDVKIQVKVSGHVLELTVSEAGALMAQLSAVLGLKEPPLPTINPTQWAPPVWFECPKDPLYPYRVTCSHASTQGLDR